MTGKNQLELLIHFNIIISIFSDLFVAYFDVKLKVQYFCVYTCYIIFGMLDI